jgi:hypothetical protein
MYPEDCQDDPADFLLLRVRQDVRQNRDHSESEKENMVAKFQ